MNGRAKSHPEMSPEFVQTKYPFQRHWKVPVGMSSKLPQSESHQFLKNRYEEETDEGECYEIVFLCSEK